MRKDVFIPEHKTNVLPLRWTEWQEDPLTGDAWRLVFTEDENKGGLIPLPDWWRDDDFRYSSIPFRSKIR